MLVALVAVALVRVAATDGASDRSDRPAPDAASAHAAAALFDQLLALELSTSERALVERRLDDLRSI